MQKLVFKFDRKLELYIVIEYHGDTISFLYSCIKDLRLDHYENYLKWACDPNEVYMGFNVAELEKENDYILIGSELSEQEDGGPFYKISIYEFTKLLLKWKELIESNAQTITIIDNDSKLDVT